MINQLLILTLTFAKLAAAFTPAAELKADTSASFSGCWSPPENHTRVLHVVADSQPSDNLGSGVLTLKRALDQAQPGDTLYLSTGNYGDVELTKKNSGFVTITAEPDQKPLLKTLTIGGDQHSQGWRISNLIIEGSSDGQLQRNGWARHPFLVTIINSANVVIEHNLIRTLAGEYPWESEVRWQIKTPQLMGGIVSNNSTCLAIVGNRISNVWDGISAGGDQVDGRGTKIEISHNQVSEFAGDGIDHYGSNIKIVGNAIFNGHDICANECIHNDGIQGWNYNNQPNIINREIVISHNLIIDRAVKSLKLPADDLHGITIFDGSWDDVLIANNVVVSPTWHGISMYGVDNLQIANNTVVSPVPSRPAWIMVKAKKNDSSISTHIALVRNNITSAVVIGQVGQHLLGVADDHNFIARRDGLFAVDYKRLFSKFDPQLGVYDLHLVPSSATTGKGASIDIPGVELNEHTQMGPPSVGIFTPPSL